MSSSEDFKATVNASLSRGGIASLPRPGEVLLLGQTGSGELVRVRIPRHLAWFSALIARSLVRNRPIERLAVIVLEKDEGSSQSLRVGTTDRDDSDEPDSANPRLSELLQAARNEWSGAPPRLMLVAGKPWPITLLSLVLLLDLVLGVERLAWTLAGFYRWMPLVPAVPSGLLHVGYLVLVAVTIQQLWRQGRAGYVLGATLAVVQTIRTAALASLEYRSVTAGQFALWLVEALIFPALITACLVVLFQARSPKARNERERRR